MDHAPHHHRVSSQTRNGVEDSQHGIRTGRQGLEVQKTGEEGGGLCQCPKKINGKRLRSRKREGNRAVWASIRLLEV